MEKVQRDKCAVDGCERSAHCRGWCQQHYDRWHSSGDPGPAQIRERRESTGTCVVDGCKRPCRARGWCQTHYVRWVRLGDPLGHKPRETRTKGACSVTGCPRAECSKGLCDAHYRRQLKRGDIGPPIIQSRDGTFPKCRAHGCTKDGRSRGLCKGHYSASKRAGPLRSTVHCGADNTIGTCFQSFTCDCPGERHNLELWSTNQPRGQRIPDKLAFVREIVSLYGSADFVGELAALVPRQAGAYA